MILAQRVPPGQKGLLVLLVKKEKKVIRVLKGREGCGVKLALKVCPAQKVLKVRRGTKVYQGRKVMLG